MGAQRKEVSFEALEDLEAALVEALPGLEIVDRDLAVGGVSTDLVGVDPDGRLVLLLLAADGGDGCVLSALDARSCGRTQLGLIARHLDQPRLRQDLEPLVVVAAERFGERAIERLAAFDEGSVRLLELRELRSASRVSAFFVPVGPGAAPLPAPGAGTDVFLDALEDQQRETADLVLERMRRLDEGLALSPAPDRLEWRVRGQPLCSLGASDGQLQGALPRAAPRPIRDSVELEAFMEATVARYVDVVEAVPEDPEGLEEVEIVPLEPLETGPLLTAEELEAFRDPFD